MPKQDFQKSYSLGNEFSEKIDKKIITKPHEIDLEERRTILKALFLISTFSGVLFFMSATFLYAFELFSQPAAVVLFGACFCILFVSFSYVRKKVRKNTRGL